MSLEGEVAARLRDDPVVKRLKQKINELKKEISNKDEVLRMKNLKLDALGHVWCSGGCEGGVFRYDESTQLTEFQVNLVEQNTIRLRKWLEAKKCRDAQESGRAMDKCVSCLGKCFEER